MVTWNRIFDSDFSSNLGLTTADWVPISTVGGWMFPTDPSGGVATTDATVVTGYTDGASVTLSGPSAATFVPYLYGSLSDPDEFTGQVTAFPRSDIDQGIAIATQGAVPYELTDGAVQAFSGVGISVRYAEPSGQLGLNVRAEMYVEIPNSSATPAAGLAVMIADEVQYVGPASLPSAGLFSLRVEVVGSVLRVLNDWSPLSGGGEVLVSLPITVAPNLKPLYVSTFYFADRRDAQSNYVDSNALVEYLVVETTADTSFGTTVPDGFSTLGLQDAMFVGAPIAGDLTSALQLNDSVSGRVTLFATLSSTASIQAPGNTAAGGEAWVVNAETGASSTFENFGFNSLIRWGDSYLGAKPDGIYVLDGDDDQGEPVRAQISFGMSTFGTLSKKMVENAYLGVASNGHLYVRITADGQTYTYKTDRSAQDFYTQRARLGKGLRATHITLEVLNEEGADFELTDVQFLINFLSRRI